MERNRDSVHFPSTAHPLFLTPNLTQVLVTLKGLREMAGSAVRRVCPDGGVRHLGTAVRLRQIADPFCPVRAAAGGSGLVRKSPKVGGWSFLSEARCSGHNVVLDCIKNGKAFCAEYADDGIIRIFQDCVFVPGSYSGDSIEVNTADGPVRLYLTKIIRSAYTPEELL